MRWNVIQFAIFSGGELFGLVDTALLSPVQGIKTDDSALELKLLLQMTIFLFLHLPVQNDQDKVEREIEGRFRKWKNCWKATISDSSRD